MVTTRKYPAELRERAVQLSGVRSQAGDPPAGCPEAPHDSWPSS